MTRKLHRIALAAAAVAALGASTITAAASADSRSCQALQDA